MELKNDVELTGKLHSVDQYLNVKLEDVQVVKKERYPQLVRCEKFAGRLKMLERLQKVVAYKTLLPFIHLSSFPGPPFLSFHHTHSWPSRTSLSAARSFDLSNCPPARSMCSSYKTRVARIIKAAREDKKNDTNKRFAQR